MKPHNSIEILLKWFWTINTCSLVLSGHLQTFVRAKCRTIFYVYLFTRSSDPLLSQRLPKGITNNLITVKKKEPCCIKHEFTRNAWQFLHYKTVFRKTSIFTRLLYKFKRNPAGICLTLMFVCLFILTPSVLMCALTMPSLFLLNMDVTVWKNPPQQCTALLQRQICNVKTAWLLQGEKNKSRKQFEQSVQWPTCNQVGPIKNRPFCMLRKSKIVLLWCNTFFNINVNPRSEQTQWHLTLRLRKYFGSALPCPKLTLQE